MACLQGDCSSDDLVSLCMGSDAGEAELDVLEGSDSASMNADPESSNDSLLAEDSKEMPAESMCEAMELEVPLLQDGGDHELTSEFSPWVRCKYRALVGKESAHRRAIASAYNECGPVFDWANRQIAS